MTKAHRISSSKIKNNKTPEQICPKEHDSRFKISNSTCMYTTKELWLWKPRELPSFSTIRHMFSGGCSERNLDWRSKKKKEKNVRRAVHIDRSKTIFCSRQSRFLRTRETYLRFLYCTRHSRIASCTYLICNATTKVPLYHVDSQFQSALDHVTGQLLGTCRSYMSNIHYISVNYNIL